MAGTHCCHRNATQPASAGLALPYWTTFPAPMQNLSASGASVPTAACESPEQGTEHTPEARGACGRLVYLFQLSNVLSKAPVQLYMPLAKAGMCTKLHLRDGCNSVTRQS